MNEMQAREELVYFSRKAQQMGLTQGSGGNISRRIPETELFVIKRTGVNMGEMTVDDALVVDAAGTVVVGNGKPSKEVNFHIGLMRLRPEAHAVVHVHPVFATAFANCELELPHTTCTSRKYVGKVPCIAYALPGSAQLRALVLEAYQKHPDSVAILMKQHGICTLGIDLQAAFNVADIVEQTAKQAYLMMEIERNRLFFEDMQP